ncbi:LacI family DNA-binding transcriptional regulator [Acidicapsa dinghuensis]|uniref:LacI family DNA-binding transcriptional regulator n=1 Tax=Acidicapsa dinghuensis TaxID=2218256 RepID=A0ABW1EKQ5_9BACT|nr:LacI family DNA-binding transcriptional regulator [Acidicapsa dinghuensis]
MATMKSAGAGRPGRQPTIIDVAREAHVGVMTVSRVINNYDTVKPVTRAKVMSAIARVGYRPNDAARMLKGMRARMIGFIVPDLSDFFSSCFHAAQKVAMQHDYQTMVVATGRSAAVENRQLDSLGNHRISGLLIVTSGGDGQRLKHLQESGIPVVALDRPVAGLDADAVLVENREGAEQGVRHLIEHGHKSIACVGFDGDVFTVRERIEGYKQAMRAAGLEPQVFADIQSLERMEELVGRWSNTKKKPSAIFAAQRISSIRLIQALHRVGLRVPQDIAVVGFDDFELADVLGTPLTVVSQSPTSLAQSAAELLFKQIEQAQQESGTEHHPAKIIFPTRLILRASCGCSPKA